MQVSPKSRIFLFFYVLSLFLASTGNARELVFAVEGKTEGAVLSLKIEAGPNANKALAVFSEPSSTLLALVVDREFSESATGIQWHENTLSQTEPMATMVTKLPEGQPLLHVMGGRPENDDRVVVKIYGDWPDGVSEERIMADARVGSGDFGFSTYISTEDSEKAARIMIEHCCKGGSCEKQKCKSCQGFAFTCCLLPNCCWIECGHTSGCSCAECECSSTP